MDNRHIVSVIVSSLVMCAALACDHHEADTGLDGTPDADRSTALVPIAAFEGVFGPGTACLHGDACVPVGATIKVGGVTLALFEGAPPQKLMQFMDGPIYPEPEYDVAYARSDWNGYFRQAQAAVADAAGYDLKVDAVPGYEAEVTPAVWFAAAGHYLMCEMVYHSGQSCMKTAVGFLNCRGYGGGSAACQKEFSEITKFLHHQSVID